MKKNVLAFIAFTLLSSSSAAMAQETPKAIAAPPLSFVDVNSGRFGKLDIDMLDGQFYNSAADKLHLTARNLDLAQGELKALDITVSGAHIEDFIIDKLTLTTEGALNFDSGLLFNQKMLQFSTPAEATVTAVISEESLNKFIKAPTTLQKLSVTAGKTGALLAGLIGNGGGNFGLTVDTASLKLLRDASVFVEATGKVGVAQMAIPLKAEVTGKLALQDGWPQMSDTKLTTSGQEISPQISEMLVKKINNLSNLGHSSDDIHFTFTDLKVVAGKQIVASGTAKINRLRFGR